MLRFVHYFCVMFGPNIVVFVRGRFLDHLMRDSGPPSSLHPRHVVRVGGRGGASRGWGEGGGVQAGLTLEGEIVSAIRSLGGKHLNENFNIFHRATP